MKTFINAYGTLTTLGGTLISPEVQRAMDDASLLPALTRIAEALERLAPPPAGALDLTAADAFIWHPEPRPRLAPVPKVAAVPMALLRGVDRQKELLGDVPTQNGLFPLLIKILDAEEKLSLQVHPPANKAAELGGVFGTRG